MARSAEQGGTSVLVPKVPLEKPPLEIHRLGSRELRVPARRISKVDASVRDLARDMLRSMYTAKGIGLAAPQVGVHRQLLVIDLDLEEAATPPMVLINPEITAAGASFNTYEEGCLSIPGVYLDVVRPSVVEVSYRDETGRPRRIKADGLLAPLHPARDGPSQRRALRRSGHRRAESQRRSAAAGLPPLRRPVDPLIPCR